MYVSVEQEAMYSDKKVDTLFPRHDPEIPGKVRLRDIRLEDETFRHDY